MLDGGETVEIAWGELRWEGARQHAGLRGFDTEKSFAQNKTLLLCKTSSVCKSLCRAEKMNFAVNAPIIFIFQKGAGKRRKGNKPIITRICLLSFCFWVLRPPLVSASCAANSLSLRKIHRPEEFRHLGMIPLIQFPSFQRCAT